MWSYQWFITRGVKNESKNDFVINWTLAKLNTMVKINGGWVWQNHLFEQGEWKDIKTSVLAMRLSSLKLNEFINLKICITFLMFYSLDTKYYTYLQYSRKKSNKNIKNICKHFILKHLKTLYFHTINCRWFQCRDFNINIRTTISI